MLDAMAELHQASWIARGQPGSFATPFFRRFHHALIDAAFPGGHVALTAISAAAKVIGILYNFSFRGRILAYQSGFDYDLAGPHGKPGLTCHHAAIRDAFDRGFDVYDFLAGNDRYKRSLADVSEPRYWVEAGAAWSPRLLMRRVRALAGRRSAGPEH
jgi:CelD/BcsL family acetyltransferase involved in cellulose biosynthesis